MLKLSTPALKPFQITGFKDLKQVVLGPQEKDGRTLTPESSQSHLLFALSSWWSGQTFINHSLSCPFVIELSLGVTTTSQGWPSVSMWLEVKL